ncbi:zinc finger protein 438 isoform X2 [Puntigrus tetrazona]|nr:zinc finger protein 438 isoform X2 [Puntigrus tetrazona]XP_043110108.1 zinc finger protein 438 isoform X2 [Puntigrus tetrazona]
MKTQEHRSSPLKSHTQSDARPHSQMKGLQFRSIAPKAPAVVPSSAVLSCQPPPALPEASTAVSPKSILVPAQNYALMQVAGQEGTFSLVALPQTQQQQPIQKNLKLPIPRYQPVRSKSAPEKGSSKIPSPAKVSATIQAQLPAVKSEQNSDSEQLVMIDAPTSSEINPLLPGSQTDRKVEQKSDAGPLKNQHGTPLVAPVKKISSVKTQIEGQASAGSAITVLSPTIFSKAVQIIPSPPKGKLPILPYAKVKNSLLAPTSLASTPFSDKQTGAKSSLKSPPDKIKSTDSKVKSESLIQDHINTQIKKPPGKKRGRKRKTMEDILAFEARKKRSLSFFRRRVPEKLPTGASNSASQEKLLDISKKYRSIRPKPVLVMETTIPQLVPLPSLSASENLDQELVLGQQISSAPQSSQATDQQSVLECKSGGGMIYTGSRPLHRCPTCNRCFQFKHHLQSHMNSHTNLRPYVCPVCRKAYAHSGSLSTHMKLHHAESRPRKSLCCEFCEKSFGYVGVYFSHLREVHRVILTVEPSISQHEENMSVGESSEADEQRVDPVELQIKCGRCQAITPTFADMKLHLLYVHGEEVQVRLRDGAMRGGREAEDELVKHAAHYWRQLNEKRNLVHCGTCDEEFFSFSKFKRHLHSHHQEARVSQEEEDEEEIIGKEGHVLRGKGISLRVGSHFNCILCSKVFNKKQDVIEHWRAQHNCENPTLLWDVLDFKGESKLTDGPN